VPYVMIYYMPVTCNAELRMLYAGAKELMRNTAEVNRIIEIDSPEDLEEIEAKLKEIA
jgi:CMP-2-keto-3-deoxyoctulosonic acid synthetase